MAQGKLKVVEDKELTIVSFLDVAILDETSIKESGDELENLVKSKKDMKLIINFANVDYLSSAVLGRLVKVYKLAKQQNGKMKLCCIKPNILQVFKITKLDKMFEILEDEDKAIKSYRPSFKLFGR